MIIMPVNSWSDYKDLITNKELKIQYTETSSQYEIYAAEGGLFVWSISLLKDDGDDVNDFDDNYKSSANKKIITATVSDVFNETLTLQPRGLYFEADANEDTTNDYELDDSIALRGAIFYLDGGQVGDWVESQIIDIDNVLGYGANFVVTQYVKKFYAIPGQVLELINPRASSIIPAGLYLRNIYHNTGNNSAKCVINLMSYIE